MFIGKNVCECCLDAPPKFDTTEALWVRPSADGDEC